MEKTKILEIIYESIDEYNDQIINEQKLIKKIDTVLYGNKGCLDSLGFVTFIVIVEQLLNDKLGTNLILVDEKALSQKNSPFKMVNTLADYVKSLIEEANE
jgi:acyl carrier protein